MMAGILGNWSITRERPRIYSPNYGPVCMSDVVDLIVMENGGDFQDAKLTADSLIIFEFRKPTNTGYEYHVREFEVSECPSLATYVNPDAYVSDFISD